MNILVLGNGFDLAHGLPTSYKDFLKFCSEIKTLYECDENISQDKYKESIDKWQIDKSIKERFVSSYADRKISKCESQYGIDMRISINATYDELYRYIEHNTWLEYFGNAQTYVGENWIDFEAEISNVVKSLDFARERIEYGGSIRELDNADSIIVTGIWKASKWNLQDAFKGLLEIDKFIAFLSEELDKLIRVLEIYIDDFVGKIRIVKRSQDILDINVDYIVSFNYSDTYERLYGIKGKQEYDYIHGKADANNSRVSNNMVLGI